MTFRTGSSTATIREDRGADAEDVPAGSGDLGLLLRRVARTPGLLGSVLAVQLAARFPAGLWLYPTGAGADGVTLQGGTGLVKAI